MARRRRVRLGKPHVKRPHPRFGPEAHERECKAHACRASAPPLRGKRSEVEGVGPLRQNDEEDDERDHADVGRNKIRHPGPSDVFALVLGKHQEQRRDGHRLPRHEKENPVARDDNERHRRDEQVQKHHRRHHAVSRGNAPQVTDSDHGGEARNQEDA